jgi:hypothetical protein
MKGIEARLIALSSVPRGMLLLLLVRLIRLLTVHVNHQVREMTPGSFPTLLHLVARNCKPSNDWYFWRHFNFYLSDIDHLQCVNMQASYVLELGCRRVPSARDYTGGR